MLKKKQTNQNTNQESLNVENLNVNETLEQLKQVSVLNELALGVAKTKDGWAVVEIAYNADTGEADLQNVQLAGTSRDEAIELFKITAVEKGIV